jgi:hypothetical protein
MSDEYDEVRELYEMIGRQAVALAQARSVSTALADHVAELERTVAYLRERDPFIPAIGGDPDPGPEETTTIGGSDGQGQGREL